MASLRVNAANMDELHAEALKASKDNPGQYVTATIIFGDCIVQVNKRLDREAPSHSKLDGYYLNGQFKTFTKAQKIADQNAGLTCDR